MGDGEPVVKKQQIPISKQKIPPPRLQLQLEIEGYQKIIAKLEREKKHASDDAIISISINEVQIRKGQYDTLVGIKYVTPSEVSVRLEKQALVRIYDGLHGHAWARNAGWIGQPKVLKKPEILLFEATSSLFEGVELSDIGVGQNVVNVVTTLSFEGVGCIGDLPASVCDMKNVQNLYLQHNLITGELPKKFSNLQCLKRLYLNSNQIRGKVEDSVLANCCELLNCDLSCNQLFGKIPDDFSATPNLISLNLANNYFSGDLPESLSCLVKLRVLKMNNNQLSGEIPSWIGQLSQLREVNLANNMFCTGLRHFIGCWRLESLVLSNNWLEDDIVAHHGNEIKWESMNKLRVLYLHRNRLVGTFPASLARLDQLRLLNLSYNNLTGVLPENIGGMNALRTLILSGNKITGPAPLSMADLICLRDFHLFKDYNALHTMQPRGFRRRTFQRVFEHGPVMQINSVHWDPKLLVGADTAMTGVS